MLAGTGTPQSAATPRTTATGEANRERILNAALARFARTGLGGTRVDEIAADAGLSKTNLLYYFRTKNELYVTVLTRTLDMWLEPLRQIDAARDPREALAHYVTCKLEAARDFPEASRLFALEIIHGAPMLSGVIAGELKELVDAKATLLRLWQAEGRLGGHEPHHLLFHIWAMTQHYADFAVQVKSLTGETLHNPAFFERARSSITAAVNGMVSGPPTR